jgi:nucleotide-binding universal stress UspA family protein
VGLALVDKPQTAASNVIVGNFDAKVWDERPLQPSHQAGPADAAPTLRVGAVEGGWWTSILRWIDVADLWDGAEAKAWFYDLLVKRPTEFTVLVSLFMVAYKAYGRHGGELTARQQQAVDLADKARRLGVNEAQYVSDRLGIQIDPARRLINRAKERQAIAKMVVFAENPYTHDRAKYHGPTERDIQRKMSAHRHKCPGKGWNDDCEGHAYGDRGLCWPCYNRYGFEGERPAWLAYLVEDNRKRARQWAIDSLVVIQVGDDDEFDALANAA